MWPVAPPSLTVWRWPARSVHAGRGPVSVQPPQPPAPPRWALRRAWPPRVPIPSVVAHPLFHTGFFKKTKHFFMLILLQESPCPALPTSVLPAPSWTWPHSCLCPWWGCVPYPVTPHPGTVQSAPWDRALLPFCSSVYFISEITEYLPFSDRLISPAGCSQVLPCYYKQ